MKTLKEFMLKPWLYLVIVLASLIVKVITVDNGFFWRDEIYTINQTSGGKVFKISKTEPLNEIKNIAYYKRLLSLNEMELTIGSQILDQSKMINLNPLHYYFLTFWHKLVGDEDTHYRFFSIFMFLLCLPVLFLLAKYLFNSNIAGWITVSLFALSPYFHFYALEARYNMLLAFLLISSHYMLLLAIDQNKLKYWILYSITGIMILYASLTAGIVLFGHFLFVMIFKKKVRQKYVLVSIIILLCYLPWIVFIINNRGQISNSLSWHIVPENVNSIRVIIFQLMTIGRSFVNFSLFADWVAYLFGGKLQFTNFLQLITSIFILIILAYSLIISSKNLPKDKFWFITFVTFPLLLFFFLVDLFRGSAASCLERYQLAAYLGILIFISSMLFIKITQKRMGFILLYLLFGIFSIYSVSKIAADKQGLTTGLDLKIVSTAGFISEAESPLIITNGNNSMGDFYTLLNECESESIDILSVRANIENVKEIISGNEYSNVYILMVTN